MLQTTGSNDLHVENITRDDKLINTILQKSDQFLDEVIMPELFFETTLKQSICENILKDLVSKSVKIAQFPKPIIEQNFVEDVIQVDLMTGSNVEISSDYTCSICQKVCIDSPKKFRQKSIECSKCEFWYHMRCVRVTGSEPFVKDPSISWKCYRCEMES